MKEVLAQYGWVFSHICGVCSARYRVYLNSNKSGVEVKLRPRMDYFKIKRAGTQISFGNTAEQLAQQLSAL